MTSRPMRAALHWAALLVAITLGMPTLVSAEEASAQPAPTPAAANAPQDATLARARPIVAAAEVLFEAGHYTAALAEFTRAYELLHGHPRQYWVLHNLAVCHQRLFHYDLALRLYEEYLQRASQTEPDRSEVEAVIRTLRALLGTIAVETSVPAEVWVDDRRLGTAPGRWFVPTGEHTVELRAAGHEVERLRVRIAAQQTRTLRRDLRRLSAITGPSRGYFWAAAGASAASAVAGTVLGVLALRSQSEGRERADLHLDTSAQSERARKQSLAADACFGGALVFGAAATVLYFVTDWSPPAPRSESARPRAPRLMARLAVEPRRRLGLGLALEF